MKKSIPKNEGFTTLLFTIMVMFLVSIVVFSMFFLCVYEYRSILNYSCYEQAYYLTLGAQEEAISKLSSNWNTTSDTSWTSLGSGEYQYKITSISPTKKRIVSQGKVATISRKFECIVQVPPAIMDFQYFMNYSLYCDGDLRIQNLKNIAQKDSQNPGIIGVTGNLLVNSITGGSSPMDVIGNIRLNQTNKNVYFKMYPLIDSNIPICDIRDGGLYTTWLAEQYSEKVHYIDIPDNGNFTLEEGNDPTQEGVWDICIVRGGQSLHIKDLDFDGLFIAENIKEILIDPSATIEGMVMVFGEKTGNVSIGGSIIGNISILNLKPVAYFSGELVYDKKILGHITSFLSYNEVNNSTTNDLTMIKWNEVQ